MTHRASCPSRQLHHQNLSLRTCVPVDIEHEPSPLLILLFGIGCDDQGLANVLEDALWGFPDEDIF